ncbi:MAG TPA: urea carboxylase-associated family protein [Vicinamibacterales bacterium]
MTRTRIAPQSGVSLELPAGASLRVIDPQGEQVADLVAFARADADEWISSGRTFDYNNTIYLTAGHVLYSNRSRPMLTIVEDTVGRHDFLYTPCSPETFTLIYKTTTPHPSCFANLTGALERYGIAPDRMPTTFNIFMNVRVLPDGALKIDPPRSKAGDFILLRAEMDLIVGLTACSAEMSNNYAFKPIDFEIRSPDEASEANGGN